MLKQTTCYSIVLLLMLLTSSSCSDNTPVPENPEELITTLRLVFTENGTGDELTFEFKDPDGDGGAPPVITTSPLKDSTTYEMVVEVLNEAAVPPIDVALEIFNESEEHQFFFVPTTGMDIQVEYGDEDPDGYPLGLMNSLITYQSGTGQLTVILRHEPDKKAEGVMSGDPTNAGGETDIEVVFPLVVE